MLAAAKLFEIRAGAIHQETAVFVRQADRVAAGALHVAEQVGLVGIGNAHGAGVKETDALELEASFKLKG